MSAAELSEQAVVIREPEQLTAKEVRAQVNLVQEVMGAVMKSGTHYGKIPGCGDKPTLLKPGAEKLASTFRLAINPEITDLSTKDSARYMIKAHITHQISGAFLGAGVGECSSNEEKYCWRNSVCDEEFNETPEDRRRTKYKSSYGKIAKVKQVRTNPADIANTVLKMAKKRALIDGILTVTGASDIFTQDIEDMPEELLNKKQETHAAPKQAQPEPPQPDEQELFPNEDPGPIPQGNASGPVISEPRRKRLYAIARGAGYTDNDFKDELVRMGYSSSKDITNAAYDDVVSYFENNKK
jgi:hypothetical protein